MEERSQQCVLGGNCTRIVHNVSNNCICTISAASKFTAGCESSYAGLKQKIIDGRMAPLSYDLSCLNQLCSTRSGQGKICECSLISSFRGESAVCKNPYEITVFHSPVMTVELKLSNIQKVTKLPHICITNDVVMTQRR